MLSTSVIQTFNCTIIRLTSTCFSVIRDNIREHRKMMVNFKPGEHMRKMFIFSQCHLNLVLLACLAWRFWLGAQRRAKASKGRGTARRSRAFLRLHRSVVLPTKPPCYAATFCSLQQALGSNQSKRLLRRLHRGRETNFIGVSPLRAGAPSSLACFSRASRSFLSPLLPSDCYAATSFMVFAPTRLLQLSTSSQSVIGSTPIGNTRIFFPSLLCH